MKKKNLLLLIVTISVLVVTIIGSAYAYFLSVNPENINGINTIANIGASNSAFTATGSNITLNIAAINMEQRSINTIAANASDNLVVSYLSGINEELSCSYDIYYKWSNGTDTYSINNPYIDELTYTISLDGEVVVDETNFVASSNTNSQKVYRSFIFNSSDSTSSIQNYEINVKYYNTYLDQTADASKNWKIEFYVDNVECGHQETKLLDKILSYVSEGDYEDENTFGKWAIINQEVNVTPNQTFNINDSTYTNVVYAGSEPDNYVMYNGEKWRILGVYNEDSHGKENKRLVKIIKSNPIYYGRLDFKGNGVGSCGSPNGSNEWSDSQLMFFLNGYHGANKGRIYDGSSYTYSVTKRGLGPFIQASRQGGAYTTMFNTPLGNYMSYDATGNSLVNQYMLVPSNSGEAKQISKTISQNASFLIENTLWHLGGIDIDTFFSEELSTASTFYAAERGLLANLDLQNNYSNTSTQRSVVWEGKIGLMYVSDYGYASLGNGTYNREACQYLRKNGNNSNCLDSNWLSYKNETATSRSDYTSYYSITPIASFYNKYVIVGLGLGNNTANQNHDIAPTLYLKDYVLIEDNGADGSYNNPFVIIN